MKREFIAITLASLLNANLAIADDTVSHLVLVSAKNSVMEKLSTKELKKAYLGIKTKNNDSITPVRNHSDDYLHEVFLQNVLYMSSRRYERQIAIRTMKNGNKPPLSFNSKQKLQTAISTSSSRVTYMWESEAKKMPRIRILQRLWTGVIEK